MGDENDSDRLSWWKRFLLFLLGIALLPAICALALAVYDILPAMFSPNPPFVAKEPLAVIAGYAVWTLIFLFLPPSIKVYVWGHELTHAIWGLLTGSKIGKIKVGENGGYVNLTNPGIFTTLAPYFVPFYMLIVLLLRLITGFIWDMEPFVLYWLFLIGFTYGFHITYTIRSLAEHQPDIKEFGHVISYALILFFNILIFGYGLVAITPASVPEYHGAVIERGEQAYSYSWRQIKRGCRYVKNSLRVGELAS